MKSDNITEALDGIAYALKEIAGALRDLGTSNADTPMGAIEMLSLEVKQGTERIAEALVEASETALKPRSNPLVDTLLKIRDEQRVASQNKKPPADIFPERY